MEKGLRNDRMAVERWKQACKAGSNQSNYRRERGLTETRDDFFVDGREHRQYIGMVEHVVRRTL